MVKETRKEMHNYESFIWHTLVPKAFMSTPTNPIMESTVMPSLSVIHETFELLDSWEERYKYIIELGKAIPPLPPEAYSEENKVRGCTSQVWLIHQTVGETHVFFADSDAFIVKGLIAIILAAYSGKTKGQILAVDIAGTFESLGLMEHLSPNRRNGFFAMVERIKTLANSL